jgi:hypothetical protein
MKTKKDEIRGSAIHREEQLNKDQLSALVQAAWEWYRARNPEVIGVSMFLFPITEEGVYVDYATINVPVVRYAALTSNIQKIVTKFIERDIEDLKAPTSSDTIN